MSRPDKKHQKNPSQQVSQPTAQPAHELSDEQLQQVTGGHSTDQHPGSHPGSPVTYPTGPV
jgi:bacteriocin-like protein